MTDEDVAISGIVLFAERLDGVVIGTIGTGPANKVTLDRASINVKVGNDAQLYATTIPEGETVTWTSSDTDVATVADGKVTGVAAGTATITASITVSGTSYTATCAVTVAGA